MVSHERIDSVEDIVVDAQPVLVNLFTSLLSQPHTAHCRPEQVLPLHMIEYEDLNIGSHRTIFFNSGAGLSMLRGTLEPR